MTVETCRKAQLIIINRIESNRLFNELINHQSYGQCTLNILQFIRINIRWLNVHENHESETKQLVEMRRT